ncbi:hypothetical protein [Shewanella sp. NFH-SH190041]|uniref:hypothetical protein n=1 Tax=Shewanella sp. NFH-SH190041 TaxID=2950245 RepID=UPI0021C2613C|nr:hypothetical protein [Shewanella sp. NFH-SH190041]
MRKCTFCCGDCSGANRAKEHIFPQHLLRRYGIAKEKLYNAHSKIISGDFSGGHISLLSPEREMTFSNFLAGSICSQCNNGWMSDLEQKVIPFIYDLIEGNKNVSDCTADERDLLARWTFKTSAVLSESTTAPQNKLLPTHAKQFYKSGYTKPPSEVVIFAYSSKTEDLLWSLGCSWEVDAHPSTPRSLLEFMNKHSYKIFIQFGRLMLVTCYWPSKKLTYVKEDWAGFALTGNEVSMSSHDVRGYCDHEADAFLMSIGVRI